MEPRPRLVAHDVSDLFNMLPTCFGFMPQESLCAIATRGPRRRFGFRLRMDLPPEGADVRLQARFVASHLRHNGAEGAIVLGVSRDRAAAESMVRAVESQLGSVQPVVMAWTDGERTWTSDPDQHPDGDPLVLDPHHPAVVAAVVAGQEILPDRATLERRWAPEDGPRRRWVESAVDEVALDVVRRSASLSEVEAVRVGLREVDACLEGVDEGRLDDGALVRLCVWLSRHGVRDAVWSTLAKDRAEQDLVRWLAVARRAPDALAAVPYTLAATAAYLLGDGAQARIGLETAVALDPGYSMARTLLEALTLGTPPDAVAAAVRAASPTLAEPALGTPSPGRKAPRRTRP